MPKTTPKKDTVTKIFRTPEEIQKILDKYASRPDGQSTEEFCRKQKVNATTLYGWVKRADLPGKQERPQVVEAKAPEAKKKRTTVTALMEKNGSEAPETTKKRISKKVIDQLERSVRAAHDPRPFSIKIEGIEIKIKGDQVAIYKNDRHVVSVSV